MKGETNSIKISSIQNYAAIRNNIKTTVISSDIESLLFLGASGRHLFTYCSALTSADIDFRNMNACPYMFSYCTNLITVTLDLRSVNGAGALIGLFTQCSNLTTVRLNLNGLGNYLNPVVQIFHLTSKINTIILDGISDVNQVWGVNSTLYNPLAQTEIANILVTLTINCPIMPNFYLGALTVLSFSSIVQVLGQVYDYTGLTAHTITFNRSFTELSQSDYDLIDAAKTSAESRNWTVNGLTYSL